MESSNLMLNHGFSRQANSYDFKQCAFLPGIVVVMEILYWQVSEGSRKEEGEEG